MGSPSYSLYDFNFGGISLQETSLPLQIYMCHGQKSRFFGDGHPTFNVGILIMGPYKPLRTWVDFSHRLLYGNNGSWSTRSHIWSLVFFLKHWRDPRNFCRFRWRSAELRTDFFPQTHGIWDLYKFPIMRPIVGGKPLIHRIHGTNSIFTY